MTTNPDVLRLAREIALETCGYPPNGSDDPETSNDYELNGCYRGAIAAIERTAQLNADHLDDIRMPTCARTVRGHYALRQPEKDKSDAD